MSRYTNADLLLPLKTCVYGITSQLQEPKLNRFIYHISSVYAQVFE